MPSSPSASLRSTVITIAGLACVLLAASFLVAPIPGTNEPHYLSKARAAADPDWCVNDFFLQSQNAHAVFFAVVGPFAKALPFTWVLVVGRIFSLLLVAIGLHALCLAVGCSGHRAIVSATLFFLIGRTGNFSGEWVIGGFESKVPAYGFAFLSLACCLRNRSKPALLRYALAGLFAGSAIAWHPVVGMWTAIAISMTEVWLWRKPTTSDSSVCNGVASLLRRGTVFGCVTIVAALPGLIPALRMLLSSDLDLATKQEAKQIQVFYRLAHHLDPTRFPAIAWWHTGALIAVLCCTVFWIRKRRLDSRLDETENETAGHTEEDAVAAKVQLGGGEIYLLKFLVCTAIIAAVGIGIGWHFEPMAGLESRHWRASLLQFYPFRLFDAFLPLCVAIFVSAIPATILSGWHADHSNRDSESSAKMLVTIMLMVIVCAAAALATRRKAPSGYSLPLFTEWQHACAWLKTNTDKDALIFAPRESFALKLYAERAEYVTFKDCPQDAAGIVEWNRRLWNLHRWSRQSYQDSVFRSDELENLHQKMGIDYVLTRRLGPFTVAPVWEGKSWRIYPTVKAVAKTEENGQGPARNLGIDQTAPVRGGL
ncbi:MAG: DUF6798 domain-containing protein [Fuerstiella sp.]